MIQHSKSEVQHDKAYQHFKSIEWKSLLNNCIEGEAYRSELEVKTVPTSITNK